MLLTIVLFAFWVLLSGKFDAFHLSLGVLSSAAAVAATRSLVHMPPSIHGHHQTTFPGFLLYIPWLLWEIAKSAWHVSLVVVRLDLPVRPQLMKFKCPLPNQVAHLTLTNSITLTPGTVTLNKEGDEYVVHALTHSSAEGLLPGGKEGDMQRRVRDLFAKWGPAA
jgi:multicomponent Na+:H+ antiporter subunit E